MLSCCTAAVNSLPVVGGRVPVPWAWAELPSQCNPAEAERWQQKGLLCIMQQDLGLLYRGL